MNNKLLTIIASVALLLGLVAVLKTPVQNVIDRTVTQNLGGSSWRGGDNYSQVGDVELQYRSSLQFPSASSTLAAFQVVATSTLQMAECRVLNTTGANEFQIGVGRNSNATTTLLASLAVGSGLYGEIVSTTTSKTIANGWILRPNDWVVFKVATGTPGSLTIAGSCSVIWHKL